MNIMTKRGSEDNVVTYEHYCDTKADLINIPQDQITLGSVAIILKDEDNSMGIYIANSNKEWISFSTGGGESGSENKDENNDLDIDWIDAITPDQEVTFTTGSTPGGVYREARVDVDLSEIFDIDPETQPYEIAWRFSKVLLVKVQYKETTFITQLVQHYKQDGSIPGKQGTYTVSDFQNTINGYHYDVILAGQQGSNKLLTATGVLQLADSWALPPVFDAGTVTGLSVKLGVFNYF